MPYRSLSGQQRPTFVETSKWHPTWGQRMLSAWQYPTLTPHAHVPTCPHGWEVWSPTRIRHEAHMIKSALCQEASAPRAGDRVSGSC